MKVERALVSVWDKNGIVEFCRGLSEAGVEIISTGGTAAALRDGGIPVTSVDAVTDFPEMLEGRVKTLHPAIHGGLLADRSKPDHLAQIEAKGIRTIDLVVINLYPFEQTIARPGVTFEEAIENIDIGGPSMIRSAAKNHASVAVLTDPADYPGLLEEVRAGGTTQETRRRLAVKAFSTTSRYDAAISRYLGAQAAQEEAETDSVFPDRIHPELIKVSDLRYGENPHQQGAFYRYAGIPGGLAAIEQLSGKELSYLNLFDVNGALELVWEFGSRPAAVIVKHSSPCGVALGTTTAEAYRKAFEADPTSAFGGIVALSQPLDRETADFMMEHIVKGVFLEVIAAPEITREALELLSTRRKNIRLLRVPTPGPARDGDRLLLRSVRGGVLVQEPDEGHLDLADAACVTRRQPTPAEREQLGFAWTVVKHVKSNAIALCRDFQSVGIGGGQTNRLSATFAAVQNAGDKARGAVLASDAYFPFSDGPEAAAKAGVTAIVQPGGSKGDESVIELANRYDMTMLMTNGVRHFRH
ncbi:MAG: bifunctional phosphoribosylaminoimidazolecarboxamide formyltransferase/IMP cyclohydrolase [Chloroflexi bacterium]|nr:bifunctional phosphoribosylaminoimidazolecarboxamide formyltransferase/IMP cyclohydrolase [Chloroflexota bacterium]